MSLKSGRPAWELETAASPRHALSAADCLGRKQSATLGLSASGSLRVPHIQDTMNLLKRAAYP
jgi:hypothetical protein